MRWIVLLVTLFFTFTSTATSVVVNTGYFLQLTDIHLDLGYVVGSPANCQVGESVGIGCCRQWSMPKKPYEKANIWGSHNCDMSPHFFNQTLQWFQRENLTKKIDFVIITGDLTNHHDVTQTPWGNLKTIELVSQQLKVIFDDTPVYIALGNHDTYPVDQFPLPPANSWLTSQLARSWGSWLDTSAQTTLAYGGYWSQRSPTGRIRMVALNSLYYDSNNYFRGNPDMDPAGQWKWLEATLDGAEMNGEHVWIIGHIPPKAGETTSWFTKHYNQLLHRYHKTIKAQFFGHTHSDAFFVLNITNNSSHPSQQPPSPVYSQGYVAPCLEALNRQPSYRVYSYDRNSSEVQDYWQYRANLSQVINSDTLEYRLAYQATKAYRPFLRDLSPGSWAHFYWQLESNHSTFEQFYSNYMTGYGPQLACDQECRKETVSEMWL